MSKVINNPIQYAVLELEKEGGWSNFYEPITQGFIVSKCWVMESSVLYYSDGNNEITHKVVFPFKDISCFETSLRNGNENIGEESIPRYDARNRPYPINVVTELFESYEEAKRMAEEQNEKHRRSLLAKVSVLDPNWKEKMETLNQEFEQKLKINNLFEQVVLEETKDMEVSQEMPTNEKERFMKILKPEKTEYKR